MAEEYHALLPRGVFRYGTDMRMVLAFGFLLLSACTLVPPGQQREAPPPVIPAAQSSAASLQAPSDDEPLENADVEAAPDSQVQGPILLEVPERILQNGIVEFGAEEAPVTLLTFTNHNCSYCAAFSADDFPRLQRDLILTGKLRHQVAILPLEKFPESALQARSLLCAAKQGKGLPMHQTLFTITGVTEQKMLTAATALQMDVPAFRACLESPEMDHLIEGHSTAAADLDVSLVPTFIVNGEKLVGLHQYADLKALIDERLRAD